MYVFMRPILGGRVEDTILAVICVFRPVSEWILDLSVREAKRAASKNNFSIPPLKQESNITVKTPGGRFAARLTNSLSWNKLPSERTRYSCFIPLLSIISYPSPHY